MFAAVKISVTWGTQLSDFEHVWLTRSIPMVFGTVNDG
jgi:hypothetical protein